jgi:protein PhnA
MSDEDNVFDEESGDWVPASQLRQTDAGTGVEVRDAVGNLLSDGESRSYRISPSRERARR